MATFQCVSMPQFITPSSSTSADIQITSNDSDSGERFASVNMSENGSSDPVAITNKGIRQEFIRNFIEASAASVGMRGIESSDDGGSTSSRQTPLEYPSPPPPSKSPPDSMPSLQAESPIGYQNTQCDVVENESSNEAVDFSVLSKDEQVDKINEWIVQQGYHPVPYDETVKHGPGMVFVHVLDGELTLNMSKDKKGFSLVMEGPGTVLMVGASGHVPQSAPFKLGPGQQCHQFLDPDGRLLHVVLSNCNCDENSKVLNVPKICRKKELMDAMGMSPSPPGPSEGGRRYNGANGRGNGRYSNGNGYHRNASGQQHGQSGSESAEESIRNGNGYNNGQSNTDRGYQSQRFGNTYNNRYKNSNENGYARRGAGHHGNPNNRGFFNNKNNNGRGKHYGNGNENSNRGNRGYSKQYQRANNQHYNVEYQQPDGQQYPQNNGRQYHEADSQQYHQPDGKQHLQTEGQKYHPSNGQQYPQAGVQQYQQPDVQQYQQPDVHQYCQPDNQQNGQSWKPQEVTINNNNAYFGNLQQFPSLPSEQSARSDDNESTSSSEESFGQILFPHPENPHFAQTEGGDVPTTETPIMVQAPKGTFPSPLAAEFHPQGLLVPVQSQVAPIPPQEVPHQIILQQNGVPMQDMQMMGAAPMMYNGMMMQPVYYQQPCQPMMIPEYGLPAPPKGMLIISADMQFINGVWVECDPELEKRVMFDVLSETPLPRQVNSLTTSCMFELGPVYMKSFQFHRGVLQLPISRQKDIDLHVTILDAGRHYLRDFDAAFLAEKTHEGKRLFNVTELIPNECYLMGVFAKTTNNKFHGVHSHFFTFRTAPGRPEPPTKIHVSNRGLHFFALKWEEGTNNGSLLHRYAAEICRNGELHGKTAFVTERYLEMLNLNPQECYNIRLTSFNACGESMYAAEFKAFTKPNRAPSAPQNVKIVSTSHRSIYIAWDENPNVCVTIECYNNATKTVEIARKDICGNSTIVNDLIPNTQYQFRLKASNEFGEQWTKYFTCHTQKELLKLDEEPNRKLNSYEKRQYARLRIPQPPPAFEKYVLGLPVMTWSSSGLPDEEYTYILEGSKQEEPYRFIEFDRTTELSYVITDPKIFYLRIVRINSTHDRSYPSPRTEIPWDRAYHKLERIYNVACSYKHEGCVIVEWKQINKEKLPEGTTVFYQVQRPELILSDLINVGDTNQCVFENIPGSTQISVQVRACFVFRKKICYGEWTHTLSFVTPRELPKPVHNVLFNSQQNKLEWECKDASTDLEFLVEATILPSEQSILKLTTKEKDVVMECAKPGQKFIATIISVTGAGKSDAVKTEISVPALVPSAPKNLFVSNIQTNGCLVQWKASEPNGAAIHGHHVHLMFNGKTIASHFVPYIENKNHCSFQLENLRSCTDYTVVVNGKNDVGHGSRVEVSFITATQLPTVPKVWSSPEPTQLKVWWDDSTTEQDQHLVYKLVRVDEKTKHETNVYQGDALQTKVKGLKERTDYIFKLQVKDSRTGAINWSEPFVFQTTVSPPPPVKQQPTITSVPGKNHLYKAEWANCLPQQSQYNQVYQLQVADATVEKARWQTEYEGKSPRYNINTESFLGAIHVRVLVVRKEAGKEATGSPSPVGYIANIPPVIEEVKAELNVQDGFFKRIVKPALDAFPAKIVLITVIVMFLFMLTFSECCFYLLTGGMVETKPPANNPFSSPPASQPPR